MVGSWVEGLKFQGSGLFWSFGIPTNSLAGRPPELGESGMPHGWLSKLWSLLDPYYNTAPNI